MKKDNILLAEFMGFKFTKEYNPYWITPHSNKNWSSKIELLQFDSDWNWLMEVVQKINLLDNFEYSVNIYTMDCYITDSKMNKIVSIDCKYNVNELINSVYEACVEFVKWYNKNK